MMDDSITTAASDSPSSPTISDESLVIAIKEVIEGSFVLPELALCRKFPSGNASPGWLWGPTYGLVEKVSITDRRST